MGRRPVVHLSSEWPLQGSSLCDSNCCMSSGKREAGRKVGEPVLKASGRKVQWLRLLRLPDATQGKDKASHPLPSVVEGTGEILSPSRIGPACCFSASCLACLPSSTSRLGHCGLHVSGRTSISRLLFTAVQMFLGSRPLCWGMLRPFSVLLSCSECSLGEHRAGKVRRSQNVGL